MRILRWIVVTLGSLVLTTLGINAFDNMDQPMHSMLGSAYSAFAPAPESRCPDGMVFVGSSDGGFCIDAYESSPGSTCPHKDPGNKQQTSENLALRTCEPASKASVTPWRNISRQEAELACARVGKRLPSNKEWYKAALGTPDGTAWGKNDCNLANGSASTPDPTGARQSCVSPAGAYDMIGNVWEWVEETVRDGAINGAPLPQQGYVISIDSDGTPIETHPDEPDTSLFDDYFWLDPTETRGIFRGGYWRSRTDGGVYSVNVTVPPSFVGSAVGFRCVKDI